MMRTTLLVLMLGVWAVPAVAQQPSAADGEKLLTEKKCTVCHLVNGAGNKKGPVLDGVGAKLSPADIRAWITNPEMAAKANIDRKPPMKAYTDLTKDEVDSLVAYCHAQEKVGDVRTSPPVPLVPRRGGRSLARCSRWERPPSGPSCRYRWRV